MSDWPVVIAAGIGTTPGVLTTLVQWSHHRESSRAARRERLRDAVRDLLTAPQQVAYAANDLRLIREQGDATAEQASVAKLDKLMIDVTLAKSELDLLLSEETRSETLIAASGLIKACASIAGTRYSTDAIFKAEIDGAMDKRREFLRLIVVDTPAPFGTPSRFLVHMAKRHPHSRWAARLNAGDVR